MYCRKCGCELPIDGKFCPKCGCETEANIKNKVSDKSGKKAIIWAAASAIIVVAIIITAVIVSQTKGNNEYKDLLQKAEQHIEDDEISKAIECWEKAIDIKPDDSDEIRQEIDYYQAVADGEYAMTKRDWVFAINKIEKAIGIKPDIADNYLLLATAYVEEWDIYNAQATLAEGYAKTKDASLKNVSIWGPLSPIEVAYYTFDSVPFTRAEYLFSDFGINSYVYSYGLPLVGAQYYCENGKVSGITLLDYDDYIDSGIFPQHLCGLPVFDSVVTYFDLEYGVDGNISAVTYDGQTFVTLSYEGNNCSYITAQTDFRSLFSTGDQIRFSYNKDDLISEVKLENAYLTFEYNTDGSYIVKNPRTYSVCTFDKTGLWIGFDKGFSAETKNGQITSVSSDGKLVYVFGYEDNNRVLWEVFERVDYMPFDSVEYFYEKINGVERLERMRYTLPDSVATNELVIEYDDHGKPTRILNEFNGYDMVLNYVGDKLTSYVMTGVDYTQTTRVINYDAQGRFVGIS